MDIVDSTPRRLDRLKTALARLLANYRFAVGPTLLSLVSSTVTAGTTLVIASQIGPAGFSGLSVVQSAAALLAIPLLMSLNYVMYQKLPQTAESGHETIMASALLSNLALLAGLCGLGFAVAPVLQRVFNINAPMLTYCFVLAAASNFNALTESFLRGKRRFLLIASLRAGISGLYLAACLWCLFGLRITRFETYLQLLIAGCLLFGLVGLAILRIRPRFFSFSMARSQLGHGVFMTTTTLLTSVIFGLDVVIMNHFAPPREVGIFSIYLGFPKRLLNIVIVEGISLVLLPTLALLDKPKLMKAMRKWALRLGLGVALATLAGSMVLFLALKSEYPYSVGLMALAAAGVGIHCVFNLYYSILSMDGTRGAKIATVCLAIGTPLALLTQVVLIWQFGLIGGLLAFIATNLILVGILTLAGIRRYRLPDGT